mmetsp:Transcript_20080/g.59321  ORF Transcript_20080/g.59321 Transcript_20080/m.59321 type:complete len:201 (-) Transcript_20080:18-620(-)
MSTRRPTEYDSVSLRSLLRFPPLDYIPHRFAHRAVRVHLVAVHGADAEDANPPVARSVVETQEGHTLRRRGEVLEPAAPIGADAHGRGKDVHVVHGTGDGGELLVLGVGPLELPWTLAAHGDRDEVAASAPLLISLLGQVGGKVFRRGKLAVPRFPPKGRASALVEIQGCSQQLVTTGTGEDSESPRLGFAMRGRPSRRI